MSQQQQQVFSGRYEMVRHIARGGMAQVYLAKDLMLNRPVAVKVLFPELSVDRSFVERFRLEAQAAANLSHPNIVSVYDWGQGEHTYFIVMEYIDGRTLSSLIREGALSATRAAAIGADVASALEFAHRRNVIHRDVKPGNVLIDQSGLVKVTDFGIARAAGAKEGLTQTGAVMGTATYFSPEQAQGKPVDARSDVYSLGVVLYEMVVGRPPFEGESPVSIAYQHVREYPALPSAANPQVPKAFEAIVMKAMAKAPGDRYPSADALRVDLMRFQQGQGVLAPMATPTMVAATGLLPRTAAGAETRAAPIVASEPTDGGGGGTRRRWLAGLFAGLLVVLAALVFVLGHLLGWWGSSTLTVPRDLAGQPVAAAKAELAHDGFTNVATESDPSDTAKVGVVTGSEPAGGATIKADKRLTLLVSSGPAPVGVPNVAGLSQQEATQTLKAKGFGVKVTQAPSSTVQVGYVISTSPTAGQNEPHGSQVTVIVSTGPQQIKVPNVAGEEASTAGAKLQAAGLVVAGQTSEASSTVAAGYVIKTDPAAGTEVAASTSVTVYVSTGPPTATIPSSLVGEPLSTAESQLTAAGFQFTVKSQQVTDPSQDGIVQSASPSPGTTQPTSTPVTLYVGAYTAPTTPSSSSTTTGGSPSSTAPGGGNS